MRSQAFEANGDRLREFYCTIGFRTLENRGVSHLKTSKKKPKFGGDTHVTQNPKTLNPKPKFGGDTHVTLNP
jgi:hypothetical protein